ncbi:DUF255 domain-containing protein [Flavobacterium sp. RSP15]|uniref:DUF255 domain-containing protein n=1 Tax=Flavobacterium sp. RSP15 TaxID=2497485 RepID=UPI000F829ECA|nr:DUF255 domain-containing protein [Flavobacterium sp. RSP15]RTY85778.1 DUF255 domain-containing protein [Flavobacterium sp. RSP15]
MNKFHFKTSPYLLQHPKNPVDRKTLISISLAPTLEKDKPTIINTANFPAINNQPEWH